MPQALLPERYTEPGRDGKCCRHLSCTDGCPHPSLHRLCYKVDCGSDGPRSCYGAALRPPNHPRGTSATLTPVCAQPAKLRAAALDHGKGKRWLDSLEMALDHSRSQSLVGYSFYFNSICNSVLNRGPRGAAAVKWQLLREQKWW